MRAVSVDGDHADGNDAEFTQRTMKKKFETGLLPHAHSFRRELSVKMMHPLQLGRSVLSVVILSAINGRINDNQKKRGWRVSIYRNRKSEDDAKAAQT
jgi:hypothetical protein